MADFTYEDYRHALISTGDAMRMDLSYNWDRKLFNRKMDMQIWEDPSLTGDNIHSIMELANSYLQTSLMMRLMQHPNFDRSTINYFMKNLNPSPVSLQQFYNTILRYDLWTALIQVQRAVMQRDFSTDNYYLDNERAVSEQPGIIRDLMFRYDEGDPERTIKVADKIKELSVKDEKVMHIVMTYFEETGSETFLPNNAKDVFLF